MKQDIPGYTKVDPPYRWREVGGGSSNQNVSCITSSLGKDKNKVDWMFGTQEQLAKEKQVSGRIQLQVWYHDEKNELVVSILAADDLAPREEGNFGSAPEAYVQLRVLPIT